MQSRFPSAAASSSSSTPPQLPTVPTVEDIHEVLNHIQFSKEEDVLTALNEIEQLVDAVAAHSASATAATTATESVVAQNNNLKISPLPTLPILTSINQFPQESLNSSLGPTGYYDNNLVPLNSCYPVNPNGHLYGDYLYWNPTTSNWVPGSLQINIGGNAGVNNQGTNAVAVGFQAGSSKQGSNAVAIGLQAGLVNQGSNAIAIGPQAGLSNQGSNAIAIGFQAVTDRQVTGSIVLNASGSPLTAVNNGLYVNPVRSDETTGTEQRTVVYNTTSKEMFSTTTLYGTNLTVAGGSVDFTTTTAGVSFPINTGQTTSLNPQTLSSANLFPAAISGQVTLAGSEFVRIIFWASVSFYQVYITEITDVIGYCVGYIYSAPTTGSTYILEYTKYSLDTNTSLAVSGSYDTTSDVYGALTITNSDTTTTNTYQYNYTFMPIISSSLN